PIEIVLSPSPDLQVTAITPPAEAWPGEIATVEWTVSNLGAGNTMATSWIDKLYLSADGTLEAHSDTLLGASSHSGALTPGASYTARRSVTLPTGISGTYHLFVVTDTEDQVYEHGAEENNTSQVAVEVTPPPPPDLQVSAASAPSTGHSGQPFQVEWTVTNTGTGPTPAGQTSWSDTVYLSADEVLNPGSAVVQETYNNASALSAGEEYTLVRSITIPDGLSGPCYIFVVSDSANRVFEASEENNTIRMPIDVFLTPWPDLEVTS
ncbi:unnamed protein product, partial [marine sediment metagenome]